MRLIYTEGLWKGEEVEEGDVINIEGRASMRVLSFRKPHKPASEGFVTVVSPAESVSSQNTMEYFVSVIGAAWIEREDRERTVLVRKETLDALQQAVDFPVTGAKEWKWGFYEVKVEAAVYDLLKKLDPDNIEAAIYKAIHKGESPDYDPGQSPRRRG